jgi:hypothetical protein
VVRSRDDSRHIGRLRVGYIVSKCQHPPDKRTIDLETHEYICTDCTMRLSSEVIRLLEVRTAFIKLVTDFLEGDYPNPRSTRPRDCEHGTQYWMECEHCNEEFLSAGLERIRHE